LMVGSLRLFRAERGGGYGERQDKRQRRIGEPERAIVFIPAGSPLVTRITLTALPTTSAGRFIALRSGWHQVS